ncbi:MAG TPA: glycoside hydrolase [Candidatus Sumerlaeota bacterium]|nr:glycoside hydrolase [Candidatus Sumerlaeota bacterium]
MRLRSFCQWVCISGLLGASLAASATETLQIRVEPGTSYQTMDGFGASDAWQCQFVGKNWPLEKRERIADLLFSREADADGQPRGIGLSIWRFNITAGTAEQGDQADIGSPWRRGECFQNPDGTYDWSKQAGQQWFLKAARTRGVEKFVAFLNSPPVQFTRNGKGHASPGYDGMNIKPGKLNAYARFLADVLEHFERQGTPFDYLSPFNEPQWDWADSKQEGTPARNVELYALVRYLAKELAQRKLSTRLMIGEAGTLEHLVAVVKEDDRDNQARFFFSPDSPFYLGNLPQVERIICAHDYFSIWPPDKQVENRRRFHEALKSINPELGYWQSEYAILEENEEIGGGPHRDLGMNTALFVARIIHHDLTITQARSWQWWTAIAKGDYKDGLVYLDDGSKGDSGNMGERVQNLISDGVIRESKLLWVLGNYSRFIRPGMVRVKCEVDKPQSPENGLLCSAYKGTGKEGVLVLVNLSKEEKRCTLGASAPVAVYTTSAEANLKKSQQDASGLKIPARAVVTVLFPVS